MEARLCKLWWVGARYNSCTIKAGEKKFDLTVPSQNYGDIPYHMLYMLRNGGGKGVFFQTLFQPLAPLTNWDGDNNKMVHFFYNTERKPVMYTIHVLEEWRVSKSENLLIGISIAPRITTREHKGEGHSSIDLEYILYSHKYDVTSGFDPFSLPLWDETEQDSLPLEEWKKYLKSQNEIQYYTMHDKKTYLELLEENGLDPHSIKVLKDINEKEQNISTYFNGATDNTGLFHQKIVPTISDKIEQIDSRNKNEVSVIISSFLETLKVAKELPQLLKMIASVEELNEYMIPIIEDYQSLLASDKELKTSEQKGGEYSQLLKLLEVQTSDAKQRKTLQEEEIKQSLRKLDWKRENLEYIRLQHEMDVLTEQYEKLESESLQYQKEFNKISNDCKETHISYYLKRYFLKKDELNQQISSLKQYESESEFGDLQAYVKEITIYFNQQWSTIRDKWQGTFTRHFRTVTALNERIERIESDIVSEEEINRNLDFEIRTLKESISQHEKKMTTMIQSFGEAIILSSAELIKERETQVEKLINAINTVTTKEKDAEQTLLNSKEEKIALAKDLQYIEKEKQDILDEKEIQEAREQFIVERISNLLKREILTLPTRIEYSELETLLHLSLEKEEQTRNCLEQKLYELQLDIELLNEGKSKGIYIPNKNLVAVKKQLEANKVNCSYGVELLKSLPPEEREGILESNPSLPYSLVVMEHDFKGIDFRFLESEELRSHVVIVNGTQIRNLRSFKSLSPQLYALNEANYSPKNMAITYAINEHEWEMRQADIETSYENKEIEINACNERLKALSDSIKQIESLLSGSLLFELEKDVRSCEQQIDNINKKCIKLDETIQASEKILLSLREELPKLQLQRNNIANEILELKQWEDEQKENERNLSIKTQCKKSFDESKDQLRSMCTEVETIKTLLINTEDSFKTYRDFVNRDFAQLKRLDSSRTLPAADKSNDFIRSQYEAFPSFGRTVTNEQLQELKRLEALETEKSQKNKIIATIQAQVGVIQGVLTQHEEKLLELGVEFLHNQDEPEEDENVLKIELDSLTAKENKLREQLKTVNIDMVNNSKLYQGTERKSNEIKDDLETDYKEWGAALYPIESVEKEKLKIRLERKSQNDSLNVTQYAINELEQLINVIKSIHLRLQALHIKPREGIYVLTDEERLLLHEDPETVLENWEFEWRNFNGKVDSQTGQIQTKINNIIQYVQPHKHIPENYKLNLMNFLNKVVSMPYQEAIDSLNQYQVWSQKTIKEKMQHKDKAEEALKLWVERASRRVIEICTNIDNIEKKMQFKNRIGVAFPLVRIEKYQSFPTTVEEIRFDVKEFALSAIEYFVNRYSDLDELTVIQISKKLNVSSMTLHVLGEYPKLKIYIPTIDGPLLRSEPRSSYYKEWEVINHGNDTDASKSGGQTLMSRFIVMAMLMRQRADDNSWLFLLSDNPFGAMSAPELVESVFSLLEILKIQWLVVAPPITNVHITSSFNTVSQMDLEIIKGETHLVERLTKKNRKFLKLIQMVENNEERKDA